jgi:hypothetical protein
MYSLIESAKLNGINPQHYLADVLAHIADHPARRIAELLPWNCNRSAPLALPLKLASSPSAYLLGGDGGLSRNRRRGCALVTAIGPSHADTCRQTATVFGFRPPANEGSADDPSLDDILGQMPELPRPRQRWTVRRKAAVIEAVRRESIKSAQPVTAAQTVRRLTAVFLPCVACNHIDKFRNIERLCNVYIAPTREDQPWSILDPYDQPR